MPNHFKVSEHRVLKFIRTNPLVSRAQIASELRLSKVLVSQIVNRFVESGVVLEVAKGQSSSKGGKKPVLLSFNHEYRYVIGVDVGGTKVKTVLTDLDGNVLFQNNFSSKGVRSKRDFYVLLKEAVESFMNYRERVLGIGIGVPGTVDSEFGFVRYMPAFDLKDLDLKRDFERLVRLPVFVGNDVTLNALGELWKGVANGYKNFLMVSLGTGTGAGIVINEELYEGSKGMAGEIGYTVTDWTREKAHDLPFGRLERWFSGYSFEQSLKCTGKSVKEFFDLSDSNDEFSKMLDEACEHLALAISNAICLLDPELVVIGGGIGYNQYERIIKRLLPVVESVVPNEILEHVEFKKAALADLGVCLGAVYLVQKKTFVI